MMDARTLVILSNVDGIFNGRPSDPHSEVIKEVRTDSDLSAYIKENKSSLGRGGMSSKFVSARNAALEGIKVIIANGKRENVLTDLFSCPETIPHTTFIPAEGLSGIKKWIARSGGFAKGAVRVNADAAKALTGNEAISLLMVGVTDVDGDFEEGDIIDIINEKGEIIAIGKTNYNSEDAGKLIGAHDKKPIVHYDYLYMEGRHDG